MSPVRLVSLLFLAVAFGVLVWTFVWVARLLAYREAERERRDAERKLKEAVAAATPALEADLEDPASEDPASRDEEEAEIERRRVGAGVNATLGLILSALACLGFWLSPLVLVLCAAGIYFSGNALYIGLRRFRVFIARAGLGLALGIASVILLFAHQLGQFEGVLPP